MNKTDNEKFSLGIWKVLHILHFKFYINIAWSIEIISEKHWLFVHYDFKVTMTKTMFKACPQTPLLHLGRGEHFDYFPCISWLTEIITIPNISRNSSHLICGLKISTEMLMWVIYHTCCNANSIHCLLNEKLD